MSNLIIRIKDVEKNIEFDMYKSVYENNPLYKNDKNLVVVPTKKTNKTRK